MENPFDLFFDGEGQKRKRDGESLELNEQDLFQGEIIGGGTAEKFGLPSVDVPGGILGDNDLELILPDEEVSEDKQEHSLILPEMQSTEAPRQKEGGRTEPKIRGMGMVTRDILSKIKIAEDADLLKLHTANSMLLQYVRGTPLEECGTKWYHDALNIFDWVDRDVWNTILLPCIPEYGVEGRFILTKIKIMANGRFGRVIAHDKTKAEAILKRFSTDTSYVHDKAKEIGIDIYQDFSSPEMKLKLHSLCCKFRNSMFISSKTGKKSKKDHLKAKSYKKRRSSTATTTTATKRTATTTCPVILPLTSTSVLVGNRERKQCPRLNVFVSEVGVPVDFKENLAFTVMSSKSEPDILFACNQIAQGLNDVLYKKPKKRRKQDKYFPWEFPFAVTGLSISTYTLTVKMNFPGGARLELTSLLKYWRGKFGGPCTPNFNNMEDVGIKSNYNPWTHVPESYNAQERLTWKSRLDAFFLNHFVNSNLVSTRCLETCLPKFLLLRFISKVDTKNTKRYEIDAAVLGAKVVSQTCNKNAGCAMVYSTGNICMNNFQDEQTMLDLLLLLYHDMQREFYVQRKNIAS